MICTAGGSTDDFVAPDSTRRIYSRLTDTSPWFLITDQSFRTQQAAAGAHVARNFTWPHAVDKMLACAKSL